MKKSSTAVIFVSTFFAFVSISKAEVGVTDTEVIIGAHTNESGPMAAAGAAASQAGAAYYDMINAQGGINGRKIKWIRKDTQSLAPKTVEGVKQLIEQDKVFAMVGSIGPSHVAVVKYINEHNVPDLYFSDGASVYLDPSLKAVFPYYYTWESEGKAGAKYIAKHMKGKKVCFLQTKDSLGQDYMKGAMAGFEEAGKDSVVIGPTQKVERTGNQADSEVLNFKQEKCDVVMTSVYGPLCSSAINYGFSQGFKPTWVVQSFNSNSKFVSLLSDGAQDGIISMTHVAREKSLVTNQKGWDAYEALMKKNNVPISGISVAGYVNAEVFTETLRRAGKDLTRESLVKAAESWNGWQCSLCLNPLKSSKTNHFVYGPAKLLVTKAKEWHLLE